MMASASPNPWQSALGQRLAKAMQQSRLAHAPLAEAEADLAATRWRLPARPVAQSSAASALTELLAMGTPAAHGDLLKRCLDHYRRQLAADATQDDLGRALAAYLGACRQAFDQEALSPARWQAITHWLKAWVIDELPWEEAPLAQRQDAFERFAALAVALGEWTVQASRQGKAQQASATWMARTTLRGQLGLDLPELCAVLRGLDTSTTAADPSATHAEIGAAAYRQAGRDPV